MTVFELINILKEYPAGSKVTLDKWDARNERVRYFEINCVSLYENGDKQSSNDDVNISIGDEIK